MTSDDILPKRVNWLLNGFRWYGRRYLKKNFHAVRLAEKSYMPLDNDEPLLIVSNHPSWWDPMLGAYLIDLFPKHKFYAAIDAKMLEKYRVFKKLGFFGVDLTSLRGATQFLKIGTHILSQSGRAVWVTAQGEFADVRKRPLALKSGVGHLASRMERGWVVPIAIEYAFWNERTPEALVCIGNPIKIDSDVARQNARTWTEIIESTLTQTLDSLNQDTMTRDPSRFRILLGGKTKSVGLYDLFRRIGSWLRLKRFDPTHDTK